jgi:DivIVA domain-containing protein
MARSGGVTLLLLLLALAVVAGVAALAAGVVTGGMDDATTSVPARELPSGRLRGADVAALRFVPALRGYRMDQVDAAMDRLGNEIELLHAELAERDRQLAGPTGRAGEFDPSPPGSSASWSAPGTAAAGDTADDAGTAGSRPVPWERPGSARSPEPGDPAGGAV